MSGRWIDRPCTGSERLLSEPVHATADTYEVVVVTDPWALRICTHVAAHHCSDRGFGVRAAPASHLYNDLLQGHLMTARTRHENADARQNLGTRPALCSPSCVRLGAPLDQPRGFRSLLYCTLGLECRCGEPGGGGLDREAYRVIPSATGAATAQVVETARANHRCLRHQPPSFG
jgi:hypothetical protein